MQRIFLALLPLSPLFIAASILLGSQIGDKAPAFTATSIQGFSVNFPSHYNNHLVLADVWAMWCGPCCKEIPNVKQAEKDHFARGFRVLGISLDDDPVALKAFIERNGMKWEQICPGDAIAEKFGVESIPAMFLVDGSTGLIVAHGRELRGPNLTKVVKRELDRKKARDKAKRKGKVT